MIQFKAEILPYRVLEKTSECQRIYPLLRNDDGIERMWLISPQHGRSFLVGKNSDTRRFIISKGNGLSYTSHVFARTPEQNYDVLGLLRESDALRDYHLGADIAAIGVRTNRMEAVIELDLPIAITRTETIKPVLLQYSVECPYIISDAAFMDKATIMAEVNKWKTVSDFDSEYFHEIAAAFLFQELHLLHSNGILHNALTSQNITWALELLDFELASSPMHPYENEDYRRHVPDLFGREVWHIYQIILDIAGILREPVNHHILEKIIKNNSLTLI